jgi:Sigma-70, region 4
VSPAPGPPPVVSHRGRPSGGSLPESARLVATVLRYFGPSHYSTLQSAVGYLMEVEGRTRSERLADRNTDRGVKRLLEVGLAQHRKDGLYELVNPVSVVVEGFIRTLRDYQNLTFDRHPVQPHLAAPPAARGPPDLPPTTEGQLLPEILREIVRLRDDEGRSWREIAQAVGVTVSRIRRAYARPDQPSFPPRRGFRTAFEVRTYSPSLLRDWGKVQSAWPETSNAVRMLLDNQEPEGLQIPGGLFLDRSPEDSRARLAYEILSAVGAFHRAKATADEKRHYMAQVIQNRRALERAGGGGTAVPSFENPANPTPVAPVESLGTPRPTQRPGAPRPDPSNIARGTEVRSGLRSARRVRGLRRPRARRVPHRRR